MQKSVYPQADYYSSGVVEMQWSEDGLTERTLKYNIDGMLTEEQCRELYANEQENWHRKIDGISWRKHVLISYYRDGEVRHAEHEMWDDPVKLTMFAPEGKPYE